MTSETPRRNLVVPPDRFTNAILSDLSRQYDREEVDRWLSEGGTPYLDDNGQSSSVWTSVGEAVSACTRDLRNAGHYPETVLAAVKSGMRQAAVPLVSEQAVENMTRKAGQTCIAAYFDLPRGPKVAPQQPPVSIPKGASTAAYKGGNATEKSGIC
ncbi:MAG: hypothetical protein ACXU9O_10625 [Gemmatimonadaceae bacterium]